MFDPRYQVSGMYGVILCSSRTSRGKNARHDILPALILLLEADDVAGKRKRRTLTLCVDGADWAWCPRDAAIVILKQAKSMLEVAIGGRNDSVTHS